MNAPHAPPRALDYSPSAADNKKPSLEYDDEWDLGYVFFSIWSSKFQIILFAFVGVLFGLFALANSNTVYRADALLQLEERSGALSLPESLGDFAASDPRSETEIQIIKSRMVLGRVVADLRLDWDARAQRVPLVGNLFANIAFDVPDWLPFAEVLDPYERPGQSIALSSLEVPLAWVGMEMPLTVTGRDTFVIMTPDGIERDGRVGEHILDAEVGFSLELSELVGDIGREFVIIQQNELSAIQRLKTALSVSEEGRSSGILRLRYVSTDRFEARRILNGIAVAYVEQNIARSAAEAETSLAFIRDQIPSARREVEDAEEALNAFQSAERAVDLSFETQTVLSQITALETQLGELAIEEDEVRQRYTQNHPVYQQLLAQRERLNLRLDELRGEVQSLPETQREIINLTRNLELAQEVYTRLLTRSQEIEVLRASSIGNVRIIDRAQTMLAPIKPRAAIILAAGLILSVVFGVFYVFVRDWMRNGIHSAEVLEQAGLPVFATINYARDIDTRGKRRTRLPLLAVTHPTSLAVEAIRSLRTSLHFGMLDAESKSIAITSGAPGAGKSFTSTNLAAVAAQAGQKVCLIDGDLRRAQIWKYFGRTKRNVGLSEYLAGEATLDEVLYETEIKNLFVITSGRLPPNPSELLMRRSLKEVIDELDKIFDLTIVDAPPTLAVTDPVIISKSVGTTVMVVRFDETALPEVRAVQQAFQTAGIKLAGAIFNGFDPGHIAAKTSYNYGYHYRYEYRARKGEG